MLSLPLPPQVVVRIQGVDMDKGTVCGVMEAQVRCRPRCFAREERAGVGPTARTRAGE